MREKDTNGGRKDIRSKIQNSKFLLQGWDVYVILFDKKNVCTENIPVIKFCYTRKRERKNKRGKKGEEKKREEGRRKRAERQKTRDSDKNKNAKTV